MGHAPYLIAVAYRKAGRHGDAALLDPVWRARDGERAVFAEYMGALRRVARETGVTLIDLQAALDAYGSERGESGTPDVFLDFVHLDETGHVVVATAVANTLVSLARASR